MKHGRHIKILGKGQPDLMRSVDGVVAFLEELVSTLGMRCLDKPHTYEVEEEIHKLGAEPFEDEGGVTGVAVLSTSHCAIHTWPMRAYFVMDVYSCRDFDSGLVEAALKVHFGADRLKVSDLSYSLVDDFDELEPSATAPTLLS